jgi:hypothetical protein
MATMLEKYATATVPRYTSYPPAPRFRAGFPAATYRDWLAALDPARTLSLYIHLYTRAVLPAALLVLRLQHEARLAL